MHKLFTLLLTTIILAFLCMSAYANQQNIKLGHFKLTETTTSLLGAEAAKNYKEIIRESAKISWKVYVPETYSADKPPGVMVFVSPINSGKIPKKWVKTMADRNLIWISANKSGNRINSHKRITYAAFAVAAISKSYQIDESRVFVSGFSGGGRIASLVSTEYPQIFKGAIYICGANFWGRDEPENFDLVKANHYVFITGKRDFNYRNSKSVYGMYKRANIDNVYFYDIPNLKHELPDAMSLDRALQFLETGN